jgi:hypothetical protein
MTHDIPPGLDWPVWAEAIAGIRHVERPFDETAGIGEQMGLLRREIDNYHPAGQSDLEHFETGAEP